MVDSAQNHDRQKPAVYECAPPDWLLKTSNSADLGFISFFPPKPFEDGDALTEATIKHGFALKTPIQAETWTVKSKQIKELKEGTLVRELEDFMTEVFQRRTDNHAQVSSSTFRAPSRATLNDAKRNAWFNDLANPEVPLHRLSKSIPHGVRGNDLLDLLHKNAVAIPRAVWFVRVFGNNETAGLRNKPNYNPLQYSIEWCNVMTGYLKKQLDDIVLPSAPRPGLNIKQTFKGVLGDPESRERWVSKFIYTLDLLRVFYVEFMVDRTTFLAWLVQTMGSSNLAQASFVARLAEEYLSEMGSCRALVKRFVDACLGKLQDIYNSSSKETLGQLQAHLENLIRRAFLLAPTSFISPTTWKAHSEIIESILTGDSIWASDGQNGYGVRLTVNETFFDVKKRNEALLFRTLSQETNGNLRSTVSDVKLLNSITSTTDLSSLDFFDSRSDCQVASFDHKLRILLAWSVCFLQYGDHRPYAAATMLRQWRDKMQERACRRGMASPDELIQDVLFNWLDIDDKLRDERNLCTATILFGELIEKGLFSYDRYIQRIIARGESGLSFNEEPGSRHRMYLREFPLYRSDPALVNQRKLALYGVRARTIPEDQIERSLKDEIRNLLPEIFKGQTAPMPTSSLPYDSPLRHAKRYEQIRVVKQWLMPSVRKFVTRPFLENPEKATTALRIYCVIVECLTGMKCYRTCLEFTLDILRITTTSDLLLAVVDYLRRGLTMWVCMDAVASIVPALLEAHQAWKARGVHIRCLVNLLLDLDDGRYLDSTSRQHVIEDAGHFAQALQPVDEATNLMSTAIPEVFTLFQECDPDVSASLANALWYKYRTSTNWTYVVWENCTECLKQLPTVIQGTDEQRASALRFAKFLLHVDLHSAEGIDQDILQWLSSRDFTEMRALSIEAWDVINTVFLHLAVHDAVKIATLLQGVIYPAWQIATSIESVEHFNEFRVLLRSATALCGLLLVEQLAFSGRNLPPFDLMEMHRLKARRKDVYTDTNFRLLAGMLPALVVIEHNESIEETFRADVSELRCCLSRKVDFRLGAVRNVGNIVDAFANPPCLDVVREALHASLVSALRLIFNDEEGDDQLHVTSLLSPWKIPITVALTSCVLHHISNRLHVPSTEVQAKTELAKLAGRLMHSAITEQEGDFVCRMLKGVSNDVAVAFVEKGLKRITSVLADIADSDPEALATIPAKAGHFLSLMSTIAQPFRHATTNFLALDLSIQDAFLVGISAKLFAIEQMIKASERKRQLVGILYDTVLFLARLLQFSLGLSNPWTHAMKDSGKRHLSTVLRLSLVFGTLASNPTAFFLLLDTAFYVFDELPTDSSQPVDLFHNCPRLEPADYPDGLPAEYRSVLATLEKHIPCSLTTSDLIYVTRDADGNIQRGIPAITRPWEWIESLGDPPLLDPKDVQREIEEKARRGTRCVVRNNTSIPLELFRTHVLGEGVRHLDAKTPDLLCGKGEQVRGLFEDDLAAESIYERHWKESRVDLLVAGESSERGPRMEKDADSTSEARQGSSNSRRTSPALSARTSRGGVSSATGPPSVTSSRRTQSPPLVSKSEAMDIDALFGSGEMPSKRKASTASAEEGEATVVTDHARKKSKVPSRKRK